MLTYSTPYLLYMGRDLPHYCHVYIVTYSQGWASVLFKRTQRSHVLLRSFQKIKMFSAFFYILYERRRGILCVLLRSL